MARRLLGEVGRWASDGGVGTATLTAEVAIPVSCDASVDAALAVARQQVAAGPLDFAYLREFDG